jgi:hypothetical protein
MMSAYFFVTIGALAGSIAHRWFRHSPFSRVDHTLIGGLVALLTDSLTEVEEILLLPSSEFTLVALTGALVAYSITLLFKRT